MATSKRWVIASTITPEADANLAVFPPILRQLLYNRGYGTEPQARLFMEAQTGFDRDPLRLTGMGASVERVCSALERHEPVAIYGDYDVDGVTATALLVQTLRALGGEVEGYIPNRFEEGYGLNNDALDALKAKGVKLVITVDCGIRSPKEAQHARDIGLDLIITDHHHPALGDLPPAFAVINPKQPGDAYPEKNLAGVGIAYKMAEALLASTTIPCPLELSALLDLVALGTVADLAPLTGENRMLVRAGLDQIHQTKRQGLYSLANVAEMVIGKTTAGQIGFILGPRLNAAGRLESALAAFDLLTTTDFMQAGQLAQQLDVQNRQRQALTRQTQEKAELLATAEEREPFLLFAVDKEFNAGVVGLAASRLTEKYYRPAIVATQNETETRGSCRSIPEFHITDALDECADLLVRHGGHAAAAGFTVRNENLPEFIQRMKTKAEKQLCNEDLRPSLTVDLVVPLSGLNSGLLGSLSQFEPTGYGNSEAVFVSRDVKVKNARTVGADGKHLKLTFEDERRVALDGIAFRMGDLYPGLPPRVDILYTFESNDYNGRSSLQLNLKDLRPTGTED